MSRSTSASRGHGPHARGAHGGGPPGEDGGGGDGGNGGRLVKVAFARNQTEAELLQGLLREAGIPSVLKRSRGFDAPEFLAAGPHDVFVDSALAKRAKELLAETLIENEEEEQAEVLGQARREGESDGSYPYRLALWVAAAAIGAAILVWILYQLS
jgi:hypothetical protein